MKKKLLLTVIFTAMALGVKADPTTLTGKTVASRGAWSNSDVTYSLAAVATALGYTDAAALKTALDAKEVSITAINRDNVAVGGTGESTGFTSNYKRGGATYNYGCFFMNAEGRVIGGWQYSTWFWSRSENKWVYKEKIYGIFANHFDYDETNIIIHLMQGSEAAVGAYTAEITLTANEKNVVLQSTLVVKPVNVSDFTVTTEGTVYVQDIPWTNWSDKNWFSINAADVLDATGVDMGLIANGNKPAMLYTYSSYTDETTYTLNNDDETNTTSANGFWLKGETGVITPWADSPEFYIDDVYFNNDGTFGGSLGEMPNVLTAGSHRTAVLYYIISGKAVKLNVVFDVVSYKITEDNNTTPATGTGLTVALSSRTLYEGWNTMVLPFAVTETQMATVTGKTVELATMTSATAEKIQFTKTESVAANIPFLVHVSAEATGLVFSGVTVTDVASEPKTEGTAFDFVGSYTATTVAANNYILDTADTFHKTAGDNTLNACRAYLKAKGVPVKSFITIDIDGTENAIHSIDGVSVKSNGAWYTLSGLRIAQPTKSGVYVKDGKKYIIK